MTFTSTVTPVIGNGVLVYGDINPTESVTPTPAPGRFFGYPIDPVSAAGSPQNFGLVGGIRSDGKKLPFLVDDLQYLLTTERNSAAILSDLNAIASPVLTATPTRTNTATNTATNTVTPTPTNTFTPTATQQIQGGVTCLNCTPPPTALPYEYPVATHVPVDAYIIDAAGNTLTSTGHALNVIDQSMLTPTNGLNNKAVTINTGKVAFDGAQPASITNWATPVPMATVQQVTQLTPTNLTSADYGVAHTAMPATVADGTQMQRSLSSQGQAFNAPWEGPWNEQAWYSNTVSAATVTMFPAVAGIRMDLNYLNITETGVANGKVTITNNNGITQVYQFLGASGTNGSPSPLYLTNIQSNAVSAPWILSCSGITILVNANAQSMK